jgi:hypothetical protein
MSPEQMSRQLDNSKDFFDVPYFFRDSIISIESFLNKTDGFATMKMSVKDVLPDNKKDYPVYGYLFNKHFINLYQNIRQKLIDLIMDIK